MAAAGAQAKNEDVEKGEDHLSQSTKSKIGSEGNYLNRCVYLEQLLNGEMLTGFIRHTCVLGDLKRSKT